MDTIYSQIIWEQLGLSDYKIHLEPFERTEGLIIGWIKNNPLEKVDEVLFGLSSIVNVVYDGYYDGNFYGINQREKENQYKQEDGVTPQSDIVIHDTSLFPTMLHLAIKTKYSPSELRFMAAILEAYYEKLPKKENTCSLRPKEGEIL